MTGQGWLVYDLTGSKQALGVIALLGGLPMFFLSPLGGLVADRYNKRTVLVVAQVALATTAFVLAAAVWFHFVSYGLLAAMALINGCTSVIEIPARQAAISDIVAPEDLANALPLNSATFNAARILGPVIGGLLLEYMGPAGCYAVNGVSFAALVFAVLAVKADLRSTMQRPASLGSAIFGGVRHVAATPALRTLVCMMMTTTVFALFYLSQLPALAKDVLRVGESGYAMLLTATGIGALFGVITIAFLSKRPLKGWIPIVSMCGLGLSLLALSLSVSSWQAISCLLLTGLFGLGQMVGTNTALQYYSPPELRGRVVSVHVWSLAGLSPVGAVGFGWLCENQGIPFSLRLGGTVVLCVGLLALAFGASLKDIESLRTAEG
jgi:predicted MFS family arabinose efflux permease